MGFEPTASLGLNEGGLPVAYRASLAKRKPWDSNPQTEQAVSCFQNSVLIQPDDFRNSDPCGSRTLPARLERPVTSPEVERANNIGGAIPLRHSAEADWEALESSYAVLQTAAIPSQLPVQIDVVATRKKPEVALTPGLKVYAIFQRRIKADCVLAIGVEIATRGAVVRLTNLKAD